MPFKGVGFIWVRLFRPLALDVMHVTIRRERLMPVEAHRRMTFWLLVVMTMLGDALVIVAIRLYYSHYELSNRLLLLELCLMGLVIMSWSVKLPSGATWRPGVPFMTMSIFLLPAPVVVLVPLAGIIFVTARARGKWWKYLESIAHVSIGYAAGAWTYAYLAQVFHGSSDMYRLYAVLPAIGVHLVCNRFISAMIVAHRDGKKVRPQLHLTMQELHWGYLNAYLLVLLAAMIDARYTQIGILLIAILQLGTFLAVRHYSHIEALRKSVWNDGLTHLENRTAWEDFRDHGNPGRGLVAVIDIDNFKHINDRNGHLFGDEALRMVAQVLNKIIGSHGRVFRVGGDEFVVFANSHFKGDLSRDIHHTIDEDRSLFSESGVEVTISVGIAKSPDDGVTLTQLFHTADKRMYDEKRRNWDSESTLYPGVPASILSLILAVESRDPYTSGHNLRVAYYAYQLAEYMGLESSALRSIYRGGLVHDVGKIGVPDAILNKPGKLTPDEIEIVREHPDAGYSMCTKLGLSEVELDVIRYHHERWDGTGYPRRLNGSTIPLAARILSVADVYDALTSNRSYRKAWSHEQAMTYLIDNQEREFDPDCVNGWVSLNQSLPQKDAFVEWVKNTTLAGSSFVVGSVAVSSE